MSYEQFLIRISFSFLLSFLIGLERQWRGRAVGLRTNVLVCMGSFLFVSFSMLTNTSDISRIAAQVVSGIGFLGAGVILKDNGNIRGLDTAATLWCNAAIGTLCAAGFTIEATIGTALILLVNIILRFVTHKLIIPYKKQNFENYRLKIICEEEKEFIIKSLISQSANDEYFSLTSLENTKLEKGKVKIYANFNIATSQNKLMEELINRIVIEPGIFSSSWKKVGVEKNTEEEIEY